MEAFQYRHELKFLCSESTLYLMEDRVKCICRPDRYAGPEGAYVIRSLYFDTVDDDCLYENISGVNGRKKYRIRIYNNSRETIRLECKRSLGDRKAKETCLLTEEQCERLVRGADVRDVAGGQELLARFLAERSGRLLRPKVIVEYTRNPYVHSIGNVRITFDRDIFSSPEVERFLEKDISRRGILRPGEQLLEVKYDEVLPAAIREVLAGGRQLRRTSFSKYALCRVYGLR